MQRFVLILFPVLAFILSAFILHWFLLNGEKMGSNEGQNHLEDIFVGTGNEVRLSK